MKAVPGKSNQENKSKSAADHVFQKRSKKTDTLQLESPGIEADRPGIEHVIQQAGLAPGSLTSQDVLQLHRTIGNQAVGRLLAGTIQRRPVENSQHKENNKSAKPIQKEENQNKTGMPDHLKSGIEQLSGIDMSDVQVHYHSSKPAQLNALAYTRGSEIHLGPGQEKHLPHESWHVVQQKQGRVKPTMQIDGIAINDDVGLEKESDVMGAKAYYHSSPTPAQKMGGNRKPGIDRMSNVETPLRTNVISRMGKVNLKKQIGANCGCTCLDMAFEQLKGPKPTPNQKQITEVAKKQFGSALGEIFTAKQMIDLITYFKYKTTMQTFKNYIEFKDKLKNSGTKQVLVAYSFTKTLKQFAGMINPQGYPSSHKQTAHWSIIEDLFEKKITGKNKTDKIITGVQLADPGTANRYTVKIETLWKGNQELSGQSFDWNEYLKHAKITLPKRANKLEKFDLSGYFIEIG